MRRILTCPSRVGLLIAGCIGGALVLVAIPMLERRWATRETLADQASPTRAVLSRAAAQVAWVAAQAAWERQDPAEMQHWLTRALAWEPRRPERWIAAARMIAFDLPGWPGAKAASRHLAAGPGGLAATTMDYAALAETMLDAGRAANGDLAVFWIERGRIRWLVRGDHGGARVAFRRAAASIGAGTDALQWERVLDQALPPP